MTAGRRSCYDDRMHPAYRYKPDLRTTSWRDGRRMNVERIIKGLALIAILGGITRIGMTPSALIWGVDSMQELIFGLLACLFMGVGVFGVYLHQAHRIGVTGFVSVLCISLSSTLTAGLVWSSMLGVMAEDSSYVGPMQSVNSLLALVGMLGFCFVTVRARIFPVWTVAAFLLFPVMSFIPAVSSWATVAWGLSYIGLGYYALANKSVKEKTFIDAVV